MKRISIILIALLSLVIGCTDAVAETGTLTINMDNRTRGLSVVDMQTEYYMVDVMNTEKSITYDQQRIDSTSVKYPIPVASGKTEIKVSAFNKDGIEIGKGSTTIDIIPNRNNVASVTVTEVPGKANLSIEVDTTIKGVSFIAEIQKTPAGTSPIDVELTAGQDGKLRGSVLLDSGFYLVKIKDSEGNYYGKVESARIFKDADITYKAFVGEDRFDVSIEIDNAIVPTPTVVITGGKAQYANGDTYYLAARATDISNPTYQWLIDETPIENSNSATITGTLSGLTEGRHYFTVIVKGEKVQWTENHEFTLN